VNAILTNPSVKTFRLLIQQTLQFDFYVNATEVHEKKTHFEKTTLFCHWK